MRAEGSMSSRAWEKQWRARACWRPSSFNISSPYRYEQVRSNSERTFREEVVRIGSQCTDSLFQADAV
ncbi:hypothetical protein JZ751_018877 [Albula glossodonta]|uniref:Uncharacterized protein n=1 Tax=Albula glossodonta TaxID=121402 RepID=A0A8T2N4J9_9TELE|nr:hypothetical protein JZ751_018877 [Albula glossodonta]